MQPTLDGIRVVEQGTFITGPCAGMMLADLGADVIKVESPDGDPYRAYQGGQYSPHFQAYNRNKRSIALDMKRPDDALPQPHPRSRRLYSEFPSGHRRTPRRRARGITQTQSPTRLLLHQRLRLDRTLCGTSEL